MLKEFICFFGPLPRCCPSELFKCLATRYTFDSDTDAGRKAAKHHLALAKSKNPEGPKIKKRDFKRD